MPCRWHNAWGIRVLTSDADLPLQGRAILLTLPGLAAMLAGLAALALAAHRQSRRTLLRRWGARVFLLGVVFFAGALPLLW